MKNSIKLVMLATLVAGFIPQTNAASLTSAQYAALGVVQARDDHRSLEEQGIRLEQACAEAAPKAAAPKAQKAKTSNAAKAKAKAKAEAKKAILTFIYAVIIFW